MEQRINQKIINYVNDIKSSILVNNTIIKYKLESEVSDMFDNIPGLVLSKEDFTKRKRIKNYIPKFDRCIANRANGEQCTRRKKDGSCFCGTHQKGRPHGVITSDTVENTCVETKVEIFTQDINGIIYYLDSNENVYDPHDILNGINNPRVISKYKKRGDNYEIINISL